MYQLIVEEVTDKMLRMAEDKGSRVLFIDNEWNILDIDPDALMEIMCDCDGHYTGWHAWKPAPTRTAIRVTAQDGFTYLLPVVHAGTVDSSDIVLNWFTGEEITEDNGYNLLSYDEVRVPAFFIKHYDHNLSKLMVASGVGMTTDCDNADESLDHYTIDMDTHCHLLEFYTRNGDVCMHGPVVMANTFVATLKAVLDLCIKYNVSVMYQLDIPDCGDWWLQLTGCSFSINMILDEMEANGLSFR